MADIDTVVKQATVFIAACYGLKTPCSSMTDCRQPQWAQKIEKSSAAPKLCSLSPTTEAFEQNVRRAHHQVALWYRDPPAMNAVEYGWESDDTNRRLIPRNMADGISYAPEHILKLVRCAAHQNDHARVGTVAAPICLHNVLCLW